MNAVHKTLTDPEGNSYRIYPSWWIKVLTGLVSVTFLTLLLVIAWLISNTKTIEQTLEYTEKGRERNAALGEFAEGRAIATRWAFEKICEQEKKEGRECLANPQWYADPAKYPLIADDPAGAGLFPPKINK